MSNETKQARAAIEEWRESLKKMSGARYMMSESGPANMAVVEAMLVAVESLDARLTALEATAPGQSS